MRDGYTDWLYSSGLWWDVIRTHQNSSGLIRPLMRAGYTDYCLYSSGLWWDVIRTHQNSSRQNRRHICCLKIVDTHAACCKCTISGDRWIIKCQRIARCRLRRLCRHVGRCAVRLLARKNTSLFAAGVGIRPIACFAFLDTMWACISQMFFWATNPA